MYEKKIVKKTKRFRDNRRLTESETFIYPVGIKSAQSVMNDIRCCEIEMFGNVKSGLGARNCGT